MHLRACKRIKSEVSLYDPIGMDGEGNEITLIDILGTDPDDVHDRVATDADIRLLFRRLGRLDPKERRVLELRFGLRRSPRKTQREIAGIMGISRSYVSRIEKKAVTKLQAEFSGEIDG